MVKTIPKSEKSSLWMGIAVETGQNWMNKSPLPLDQKKWVHKNWIFFHEAKKWVHKKLAFAQPRVHGSTAFAIDCKCHIDSKTYVLISEVHTIQTLQESSFFVRTVSYDMTLWSSDFIFVTVLISLTSESIRSSLACNLIFFFSFKKKLRDFGFKSYLNYWIQTTTLT